MMCPSWSPAYISNANPIWRRSLLHWMTFARSFALARTGSSSAARIAMMAMTTNNSINVKAGVLTFGMGVFILGQMVMSPVDQNRPNYKYQTGGNEYR